MAGWPDGGGGLLAVLIPLDQPAWLGGWKPDQAGLDGAEELGGWAA